MNLGIIGTGSRSQDYVDALRARGAPSIRVAALADADAARLERFAAAYFPVGPVPRLYASYPEMLDDTRVDAVMICTPDATHKEITIASLRKGKHVFCEKPLATTLEDCLEVQEECLRHRRVFHLGFGLRQAPFYRTLKELVSSGVAGQIVSVEAHEALGTVHAGSFFRRWPRFKAGSGGLLNFKCCHDLDILNWLIGSRPAYVSAMGGRSFFTPRAQAAERCRDCGLRESCRFVYREADYRRLFNAINSLEDLCVFNSEKDIVDHEVVSLAYQNGVTVSYTLSLLSAVGDRTMTIFGSEATLLADAQRQEITCRLIHPRKQVVHRVRGRDGGLRGDIAMLRRFAESVSRGEPSSDVEAGVLSSGVALLAERSMERHEVCDASILAPRSRPPGAEDQSYLV
jgi:predicted dehydrogenase